MAVEDLNSMVVTGQATKPPACDSAATFFPQTGGRSQVAAVLRSGAKCLNSFRYWNPNIGREEARWQNPVQNALPRP
jgi:hypothetical protein